MEQQRAIIETSLTFFKVLGIHPLKTLRKIPVLCLISSHLILFALVCLRFFYEKITFGLISDTFESTFTIVHVLAKFITLVIIKPTIKKLFETTNTFWLGKTFQKEFRHEVDADLRTLGLLLRLFLFFVSIVIVTFAIRPIFDDTLAIHCYVPEFIPRAIFIVFNNAVFAVSAFAVGSFDMFVCVMVVLITVQFKILNYSILGLDLGKVVTENDEKLCQKKIKIIVDYHDFLDRYLAKVSSIVSPALLVYFTIAPIVLCFELFFMSKSSNFAEIAKSCVYILGIVIELFFFFCLPATYLMVQTQLMITTVYNSGWENCYFLSVRKSLIIMMQRMQKETLLTAGKMIKINLETCTNAFRMALSFYTSLQILDDKSRE
ncbi:odorant receptor 4 [Tribolium castaneum]|uniref:Odorant receptor n=1 Tax=Tribolium castaneum TaxID=7070 RepID=D2A2B6_TRICA|nr:PREDICTED: odorant receptor 4-like [Tribolium castaneum]EFA02867.1 odorant receptor 128 [Tribolium castaneum]|eukprot:XP_015835105.1 PREDICTED: odorant receptor 4-like [Tribolium castaneum]